VWLGRATGRRRAGFFAAIILATAVHFTWLARIGRVDMPLTCAVTAAAAAFYVAIRRANESGRRAATGRPQFLLLVCGYLALAAGLMLKGPIACVLLAAILAFHRSLQILLPPAPFSIFHSPSSTFK